MTPNKKMHFTKVGAPTLESDFNVVCRAKPATNR